MFLQRLVGRVLLELSELSSRAFSQSGNNFSCVVPVMMLLTSVSEKQRTNISTDRSGIAPKSAFWFGLVHTGYIGTGFRYATLATSGFFKGASERVLIWLNFSTFTVNVDWPTVSENSFKQSHSRTFTTPSNTQQCFITESFSIFEEIGRVDDSETHSFTYASLRDLLPPTGGLVSHFDDTDKTLLLYYLVE